MQAGIVSAGADVMLVGPLPTPGIAFITWSMRADAGVVISASHNPYQDNGIKIFAADGFKLPDDVEADIERRMEAIGAGNDGARAAPDAIGKAVRIDDAVGRYVQFLKQTFPKEHTLDGMKVVVDCSNGAAYQVAPQVFQELGAEVIGAQRRARRAQHQPRLRRAPPGGDGRRGAAHGRRAGRGAGRRRRPADPRRREGGDRRRRPGDGDPGDAHARQRGSSPSRRVVATVMSNLGLERALVGQGGQAAAHGGRRPLRRRGDARARACRSGASSRGTSSSSTTRRPATA